MAVRTFEQELLPINLNRLVCRILCCPVSAPVYFRAHKLDFPESKLLGNAS